ncbi:hypothetical protein IE53DRAFT_386107 [Violaceomyces palustris]|uniref:Uncharacterized protein n=1 Tax=Violaceomyces palustris TaxID=1673888 RepID=A0ACD0P0C6_9BASI|nr:hypothetical protein IE53DRAFT_386107 [Violaceomyces palustris]
MKVHSLTLPLTLLSTLAFLCQPAISTDQEPLSQPKVEKVYTLLHRYIEGGEGTTTTSSSSSSSSSSSKDPISKWSRRGVVKAMTSPPSFSLDLNPTRDPGQVHFSPPSKNFEEGSEEDLFVYSYSESGDPQGAFFERLKAIVGKDVEGKDHPGLYQLLLVQGDVDGLEGRGDQDLERFNLRSVKGCHLNPVHLGPDGSFLKDFLIIHPSGGSDPSHLRFTYKVDLSDAQMDQRGCPIPEAATRKSTPPTTEDEGSHLKGFNTTLKVQLGQKFQRPKLRTPLPVKEDGTVEEPVKEKTFLQKYWMYLIPIAFLLILPPGGEEPSNADSGSTRSGGNGARRLQ